MGCRTTAVWPSEAMALSVSSTVGPIQGPPATPWLWKAKNHLSRVGELLRGGLEDEFGGAFGLDRVRIGGAVGFVGLHGAAGN